ncbi:MAG TPA: hypothetical protein DCP17_08465, partial [Ruminococcaceae bacterium]|nr:hypothetical protein [Oscillospiraceae bacterium]
RLRERIRLSLQEVRIAACSAAFAMVVKITLGRAFTMRTFLKHTCRLFLSLPVVVTARFYPLIA